MPEEQIFSLKTEDFTVKKKSQFIQVDEHAIRLDKLEAQLADAATAINNIMQPCIDATKNIIKLAEKMPEVLNLRQRLVDDKRFFDSKAARMVGILARNSAKLKNDFSTGGMKLHEQNSKLKGENSYYEEEHAMIQAHVKFLEGSVKTVDSIYYQFKDKALYEEKYKL